MYGKEQPFDVCVECLIEVFFCNFSQGREGSTSSVGKEDIEMAMLLFDKGVKPIKVR
ncbi:hypothetical protein KSX_78670 [Ktedonospora formicarum]|uniref:Uncharacterized protein n=1 Tax=Ktedonospora formicarum TaxID=2778364 RepID=A0A8J3IEA3_9CHLR|nr:hypothetical protein KSX_78670 [Ktedonospora formicarum]